MDPKIGSSHLARKALFRKGVQERRLTTEEIEAALPEGSLTPAERWLLYYSLRAAGVEILGEEEAEAEAEAEADERAGEPLDAEREGEGLSGPP